MNTGNKETELAALLDALSDGFSDEELLLSALQAEISATITAKRIAAGLSQAELAERLNVSQGMISKWENGGTNFTLQTLIHIAQNLEIEVRSPFVAARTPHYHSSGNITRFPCERDAWRAGSYAQSGYEFLDERDEM